MEEKRDNQEETGTWLEEYPRWLLVQVRPSLLLVAVEIGSVNVDDLFVHHHIILIVVVHHWLWLLVGRTSSSRGQSGAAGP